MFGFGLLGGIVGLVVVIGLVLGLVVTRLKKVGPTDAMVLTANKDKNSSTGSTMEVIKGGRKFVIPFLYDYIIVSLVSESIDLEIDNAPTQKGTLVSVKAFASVKIGGEEAAILAAAERFGKDRAELIRQSESILAGSLRSIVSTMSVEELNTEREVFRSAVVDSVGPVLERLGLVIDTLQILSISDKDQYLENLAKPQAARVKQAADIAAAETDKETTVARALAEKESKISASENKRLAEIAQAENDSKAAMALSDAQREQQLKDIENKKILAQETRDLELVQASAKKAIAQSTEEAEAASVIEQRRQEQLILEETRKVTEAEAQVEQAKLEISVVRPAEARKREVELKSDGEYYAEIKLAESAKNKSVLEAEGQREIAVLNASSEQERAKAIKYIAEADAESIKLKNDAEAAGIQAKALAKAAGIEAEAEAYGKFGEAAIIQTYLEKMPESIRAAAEPLANIKDVRILASDGSSGMKGFTNTIFDTIGATQSVFGNLGLEGKLPSFLQPKQDNSEPVITDE